MARVKSVSIAMMDGNAARVQGPIAGYDIGCAKAPASIIPGLSQGDTDFSRRVAGDSS